MTRKEAGSGWFSSSDYLGFCGDQGIEHQIRPQSKPELSQLCRHMVLRMTWGPVGGTENVRLIKREEIKTHFGVSGLKW